MASLLHRFLWDQREPRTSSRRQARSGGPPMLAIRTISDRLHSAPNDVGNPKVLSDAIPGGGHTLFGPFLGSDLGKDSDLAEAQKVTDEKTQLPIISQQAVDSWVSRAPKETVESSQTPTQHTIHFPINVRSLTCNGTTIKATLDCEMDCSVVLSVAKDDKISTLESVDVSAGFGKVIEQTLTSSVRTLHSEFGYTKDRQSVPKPKHRTLLDIAISPSPLTPRMQRWFKPRIKQDEEALPTTPNPVNLKTQHVVLSLACTTKTAQNNLNLDILMTSKDPGMNIWKSRIIKRTCEVDGRTWTLHDVYGLQVEETEVQSPVIGQEALHIEREGSTECTICLAAQRNVILLPCRHLVACRDCAIRMNNFGAGDSQSAPVDGQGVPTETVEQAGGSAVQTVQTDPDTVSPETAAVPDHPTLGPRRRRGVKGWLCPFCREPYTAMLCVQYAPESTGQDLGLSV